MSTEMKKMMMDALAATLINEELIEDLKAVMARMEAAEEALSDMAVELAATKAELEKATAFERSLGAIVFGQSTVLELAS